MRVAWLAIIYALTLVSCTTEIEMNDDNICYDKCLSEGLYMMVDTDDQCICGKGIE